MKSNNQSILMFLIVYSVYVSSSFLFFSFFFLFFSLLFLQRLQMFLLCNTDQGLFRVTSLSGSGIVVPMSKVHGSRCISMYKPTLVILESLEWTIKSESLEWENWAVDSSRFSPFFTGCKPTNRPLWSTSLSNWLFFPRCQEFCFQVD